MPPAHASPGPQGIQRIAVFGAALWLATVVIPGLLGPWQSLLWGLPAPLMLALGLAAHQNEHRFAPAMLLGAFPLSLAPAVVFIDNALPATVASRMMGAVAFLLYGAVAVSHLDVPKWTECETAPLATPRDEGKPRRRWRSAVLWLAFGSALAWLLLAGAGDPAFWQRRWPDAALEAQTVSILVAGLFGTTVLIFFLAPATRRDKRLPTRAQRNQRAWLLGSVAVAGALVLWMLQNA